MEICHPTTKQYLSQVTTDFFLHHNFTGYLAIGSLTGNALKFVDK